MLQFLKSSLDRVKKGLAKTRSLFSNRLKELFSGKIDEETLDKLEQLLFEADFGIKTTTHLVEKVRQVLIEQPQIPHEQLIQVLKQEILKILTLGTSPLKEAPAGQPTVFLIVGVNGNGKTTTVAKLTKRFSDSGRSVLVAAADTFRAAAIDQLEMWAERLHVDIVKGAPKSDPSSVAFDALTAAMARKKEIAIIDTAGRLHTKTPLMAELQKIRKTCQKVIPDAPHETLLVLDATTGQNALDQASTFSRYAPITGLILTKLDGTAKGGIAVAIQRELNIPIQFIGTGEGPEDLEPFDPISFVDALF